MSYGRFRILQWLTEVKELPWQALRKKCDANLFRLGSLFLVQGRSHGGGCGVPSHPPKKINMHIFFQKYSKLHERCGTFWNKWKIYFQIFIFRVIVIFVMSSLQFSMNFSRKLICDRPYHSYFQIGVCWIFLIEIGP